MIEYTRPATWEDVKALARYLDEAAAEYALVGAYALAAHGYSRFSEDIDILVNPTADNARRWILALSRLPDRAAAELAAEGDVFADDKRYAIRINELPEAESERVLQELFAHQLQEKYIYTHTWSVGDVLVWDHIGTLHNAVPDYGPHEHRLISR